MTDSRLLFGRFGSVLTLVNINKVYPSSDDQSSSKDCGLGHNIEFRPTGSLSGWVGSWMLWWFVVYYESIKLELHVEWTTPIFYKWLIADLTRGSAGGGPRCSASWGYRHRLTLLFLDRTEVRSETQHLCLSIGDRSLRDSFRISSCPRHPDPWHSWRFRWLNFHDTT